MMASTRHLHHKNLRVHSEEGIDDFKYEPHTLFDDAVTTEEGPSEENLAKFLFIDKDGNKGQNRCHDCDEVRSGDEKLPILGIWEACCYALALEPMEIRNERIIMVSEAYALFGALLMNAVWILYEWGSWKGYGDGVPLVTSRVFECIMAIALACITFVALLGANLWIHAINTNSYQESFYWESTKMLQFLSNLLLLIIHFIAIGLFLGIYGNLSPFLPETVVALFVAIAVYILGYIVFLDFLISTVPLEIYHSPFWLKLLIPRHWYTKKGREKLVARAKLRAEKLRKRAYRGRKKTNPCISNGAASISINQCHQAELSYSQRCEKLSLLYKSISSQPESADDESFHGHLRCFLDKNHCHVTVLEMDKMQEYINSFQSITKDLEQYDKAPPFYQGCMEGILSKCKMEFPLT